MKNNFEFYATVDELIEVIKKDPNGIDIGDDGREALRQYREKKNAGSELTAEEEQSYILLSAIEKLQHGGN